MSDVFTDVFISSPFAISITLCILVRFCQTAQIKEACHDSDSGLAVEGVIPYKVTNPVIWIV